MDIVISPAKKLNFDHSDITVAQDVNLEKPTFIKEATELATKMANFESEDLSKMMKVSKALADLNVDRFNNFKKTNDLGAAIFSFAGDTYQGLNAGELKKSELNYAQKHLKILSGLYGVLAPFDELRAYRLEMGTRINGQGLTNLYNFWGEKIVEKINEDAKANKSKYLVNLASEEYFKSVKKDKLVPELVNVRFLDFKNGQYKVISFNAKRARGMMARFIIENKIKDIEGLKNFDVAGYKYADFDEVNNELIFKRKES
ncbi:peroxide stress protein YaaA [Halobacteriovorax sp. RT-2-4]|uniref:peroxide stress protein YaaA n=1 Tax=unclassified Halobacteriovorax TaxID=2639665 RepID=UPI00399A5CE2